MMQRPMCKCGKPSMRVRMGKVMCATCYARKYYHANRKKIIAYNKDYRKRRKLERSLK